jgi:uncharacterized RDD family membrane protein YckC
MSTSFTDPTNPYAAPRMPGEYAIPAADAGKPQVASQGKRFLNLIIDNVLMIIVNNGIGFIWGMAFALSRVNPAAPLTPSEVNTLNVVGFLIGMVTALTYFVVMETVFQRTVGKFITGTKVVSETGSVPTFTQILGRSFARYIPFEAFSFLGNKGFPVGWHDSLSGTRVVKA